MLGTIPQETLVESDGNDQLNNHVGKVLPGDVVTINIKGNYITAKKLIEFEDTYHSTKPVTFTVGDAAADAIPRGLREGIQDMILGEQARFTIRSDYAYGEAGHKGYCGNVPPNADIVLEVALMKVGRKSVVHFRKQPKDTASLCEKLMYCLTRDY
jgi:FKBP-type peptidyl-prolyl cis-trans isomerase